MGYYSNETDDWAVVRVKGNPNLKYGHVPLEPTEVAEGARVNIIQHPGGGPKMMSYFHNLVAYVGNARIQYLTDTQPGSSGAPVFDASWRLVGLHHRATWGYGDDGFKALRNEGIHVKALVEGLLALPSLSNCVSK